MTVCSLLRIAVGRYTCVNGPIMILARPGTRGADAWRWEVCLISITNVRVFDWVGSDSQWLHSLMTIKLSICERGPRIGVDLLLKQPLKAIDDGIEWQWQDDKYYCYMKHYSAHLFFIFFTSLPYLLLTIFCFLSLIYPLSSTDYLFYIFKISLM